MLDGLRSIANARFISEVRNLGLAVAIGIGDGYGDGPGASACCLELMARGVLTTTAAHAPGWLRLTPPLTIAPEDVDLFLSAIDDSFAASIAD
jgi:4-aminobutyrate aminotransferase-like enzyme